MELDNFLGAGLELRGTKAGDDRFEVLAVPERLRERQDGSKSSLGRFVQQISPESLADRLFIDCILQDKPASPTCYDGLTTQEVIDAALDSHRTGT